MGALPITFLLDQHWGTLHLADQQRFPPEKARLPVRFGGDSRLTARDGEAHLAKRKDKLLETRRLTCRFDRGVCEKGLGFHSLPLAGSQLG